MVTHIVSGPPATPDSEAAIARLEKLLFIRACERVVEEAKRQREKPYRLYLGTSVQDGITKRWIITKLREVDDLSCIWLPKVA